MDWYPFNLSKNQKYLHYAIAIAATLAYAIAFYANFYFNFYRTSYMGVIIYWEFLPTMILSGLFGYVPAMIYVLIILGEQVFFDIQLAPSIVMHLFIVMAMYMIARKWWFKSIKKLIIAFFSMTILVSIVYVLLLRLSGIYTFIHINIRNLVLTYVGSIAQVLISFVFLYIMLIKLPDKYKILFSVGHYYTSNYVENEENRMFDKTSDLRQRVVLYVIVEMILISLIVAIISTMMLTFIGTEGEGNINLVLLDNTVFINTNTSISIFYFAFRVIMIIMCLVIPVVSIFIYSVQKSILFPIRNMTSYLRKFSMATSTDERRKIADDFDRFKPKRKGDMLQLYDNLNMVMVEVMDFTERFNKEQELKAELEIAKQASEAKNRFLSNVSHEIRTPINAVLGMDELIIRESSEDNIRGYAFNIKNAGNTLLSLISDVLDFSKIEAGKMEIIEVEYDLASTINDLLVMIDTRAKDKGLNFNVYVEPKIPKILYGDELRLKQCILNLLTNAVKYTSEGLVALRIDYEPLDEGNIKLKILVEDTGMGIAKEDIDRFVKPFERLEMVKNRTTEGTGLGMSIVTRLLEMMGARLEVNSKLGEGSRFLIEIKQKVIKNEPIGQFVESYMKSQNTENIYKVSFKASNARILVVDDTEMNLIVIKGLLKDTQIQIDTALSAREGLKLIDEIRYDVIFIDHRMPEISGIEMLHMMEESKLNKNLGVPVIALTANVVSGARDMYISEGFTDYMSKPVDGNKLEELLLYLIDIDKINKVNESFIGTAIQEASSEVETHIRFNTNVEGINFDEALVNCGDEDVLEDVLNNFLDTLELKHDAILKAYEEEDIRNYTIQVHALKSSSRLIGAMDLSNRALRLEEAGNAEDIETIKRDTPSLLEDLLKLKDKILAVLKKDGEMGNMCPLIDDASFKNAMKGLEELVLAFDFDGADSIMDMLSDYCIPDRYSDIYNRLKQLMAAVDIDGLNELLRDFNQSN